MTDNIMHHVNELKMMTKQKYEKGSKTLYVFYSDLVTSLFVVQPCITVHTGFLPKLPNYMYHFSQKKIKCTHLQGD